MVHITPYLSSEEILNEADKRLNEVRSKMFRQIAKELCNLDQYYYVKSYDWALEGNSCFHCKSLTYLLLILIVTFHSINQY